MASRQLDEFEQFAIEVILERRKGKRASLLRFVLWMLSGVFRRIVAFRLWLFRKRVLKSRSPGAWLFPSVTSPSGEPEKRR